MIKHFLIIILICASISLPSNDAFAGSRDGYVLLLYPLDNASENELTPILKRYFNHKFDERLYETCNSSNGVNTELAYIKKRPNNLQRITVLGAIHNEKIPLEITRTILSKYRDAELLHGFDALIVYRFQNGEIEFWGISPLSSESNTFAVSESLLDKDIAEAICKILTPFPYAFAP
jgi:hypothetical protein